MEEKRKLPTPAMLAARERIAKKTPEEQEAVWSAFREELRRYYENRPPREVRRALLGLDTENE